MERDNPFDDVSEEELLELFRSAEAPLPSAEFASRTMRAVMREPVQTGRNALRDPLKSLFGWAAVIAAVALTVLAIVLTQPVVASGFSRLITLGVGTGVWLMQFAQTGVRVLNLLATAAAAVSRAMVTAEGTTGLVLTAVVGALSLSALHRLLISKREDSQWQELS